MRLEQLSAVAAGTEEVRLAEAALAQMAASRRVVERALETGDSVYGLNTGVAERKRVRLGLEQLPGFNRRLIANHLVAQGPPAAAELVRATLCCLANGLASGYAGVRPELALAVVEALNSGAVIRMRTLGSVGEADLGPLADLASAVVAGQGIELAPGEALALIDNNAFSTAWAALSLAEALQLLEQLEVAAALDFEGYAANLSPLHPLVEQSRRQPGIAVSRRRLAALLETSYLHDPGAARQLQDPLSFRTVPQVHGAARDALAYACSVVETDANAFLGNPLVAFDGKAIVSVGNFDAVYVAAALDFARVALAPVLSSAAERAVKLLQASSSGLSAGLSADPDGADDGLAELAVAAQSFTAEARLLAFPVSFELVSTSKAEGIEDRTAMAPLSARRLGEMAALGRRLLAVELVVACQAIDLRIGSGEATARLGTGTAAGYAAVRRHVGFADKGSLLVPDLEALVTALRQPMLYARAAVGSADG